MTTPKEAHDTHELHETHAEWWLDQYWWVFLIIFGMTFVLWLALFHPVAWW